MIGLKKTQQVLLMVIIPVLFMSCASYNKQMTQYYTQLQNKDYNAALKTLNNIRIIKKDRNRLLYFYEKGLLYHLMQNFDNSNKYFNLADDFIESKRLSAADIAKAYLLNPMMKTYMGEDMERFMMHYYKALNYLQLNQVNSAVVEARRITLANNQQQDKFGNKSNRYIADAFSLNLQGMLYEANGEINNAFISYRNAADIYLNAHNNWYGVTIPKQLQQDVLRTAHLMGFEAEKQQYEQKFKTTYTSNSPEGGELIIFFEKGLGPVKKEQNIIVTRNGNGFTGLYFTNEYGNQINIPFDITNYSNLLHNNNSIEQFRTFRVAMPYYELRYFNNNPITVVTADSLVFKTEQAQNINVLATQILKERYLKEIADAVARQIVKKLTETGVKQATKSVSENNSKEKDKEKKEKKAKTNAEIAGFLVNTFNALSEKADTRNWQSLPAFVHYARVPLQKGDNTITICAGNVTKKINLNGNGTLQFYSMQVW